MIIAAIIFLLTGFYWFIMIFNEEIKETFHVSPYQTKVNLPSFGKT